MQGHEKIRGELLGLILVLKMGLNGLFGCMSVVSRKTLFFGRCVELRVCGTVAVIMREETYC